MFPFDASSGFAYIFSRDKCRSKSRESEAKHLNEAGAPLTKPPLSILLQMIVAAAAAAAAARVGVGEGGGFPPLRSAPLINLLAAGAHAAHIYIFSSRALAARDRGFSSKSPDWLHALAEIGPGSPSSLCKAAAPPLPPDAAHADTTRWVWEIRGSVGSDALRLAASGALGVSARRWPDSSRPLCLFLMCQIR